MSQERLQQYFDLHPVRRMGHDSHTIIYDTDDLLVRKFDAHKSTTMSEVMRNVKGSVSARDNALAVEQFMRKKAQEGCNHYWQGLSILGGLAVPYEMPEELKINVRRRLFGFLVKSITLKPVVVQQKPEKGDVYSARLDQAVKIEDIPEIKALLERILEINTRLIQAGVCPTDPSPENYVIGVDGSTLIQNIGGVITNGKEFGKFIDSLDSEGNWKKRNNQSYIDHLKPLRGNEHVADLMKHFTTKLEKLYKKEAKRIFGSNKRPAPVPKLQIP